MDEFWTNGMNIQVLAICVSDFDIILLVCKKRGDGFYVGFQKNGHVYFMAHPSA